MANLPLVTCPLRYLIGANDERHEHLSEVVEYSYDASTGKTRYKTLTSEKERFDSRMEANSTGKYKPYLPPTDITGDYGEWMPDPRYPGFMKNVRAQVDYVVETKGERIELDNPDFDGLNLKYVLQAHDYAWSKGLHTIGKNPLLTSDPVKYLQHPSIDMVVVEHGAGGSDRMDVLRRRLHLPFLAVRFVAFIDGEENGSSWAQAVSDNIKAKRYKNMGVTISRDGEYTSFIDLCTPTI